MLKEKEKNKSIKADTAKVGTAIGLDVQADVLVYVSIVDINNNLDKSSRVMGLRLRKKSRKPLLRIIMPCGEKYEFFKFKDIPDKNLRCACGNPKHWVIKYETSKRRKNAKTS